MGKERRVTSRRTRIRPSTRQLVLLEAGYMCGNPRCRHILTLNLHHIVRVKDGGGNEPNNLLALCPNCHALHTHGHIPDEAIRVWKGVLLSLNNVNRANIDILLLLHRLNKDSFGRYVRYSGESLLQLAGLISSGLVVARPESASGGGGGFPPYSAFVVSLTEAGTLLVEAWLQGDEARLRKVLKRRELKPSSQVGPPAKPTSANSR